MNIFEKIKFLLRKPKIVVLTDNNRELVKRIAARIVGSSFAEDLSEAKKKKLSSTWIGREVLFADDIEKIDLSSRKYLIFNFDKEGIRKIKEMTPVKALTFGFQEGADFQVTDVKINGGTNFKVNYQGKIVPIWLMGTKSPEEIYPVLAAVAIGTALGLNLIEISQILKEVDICNKKS